MKDLKISEIIEKFKVAANGFQRDINLKTLNIGYKNGGLLIIATLATPTIKRGVNLNEGVDLAFVYLDPPNTNNKPTIPAGFYLVRAVIDRETGIRYIKHIDNRGREASSKPTDFVIGQNITTGCDAGIDLSLTGVCAYVECEVGPFDFKASACYSWI